ncbi:hypothetical protein DFJ73DRAFT_848607 [Zopfochytrium polystomum]|nr:hypothetical protein DFJ73DRAFT_848607 [Zopfochytrium polystomum]
MCLCLRLRLSLHLSRMCLRLSLLQKQVLLLLLLLKQTQVLSAHQRKAVSGEVVEEMGGAVHRGHKPRPRRRRRSGRILPSDPTNSCCRIAQ